MESPLCLIENPVKGNFQVNAEAIAVLSNIDQPVVVVAIAGPCRAGKSYLMNLLAGAHKGFGLGSTVQGKTKGIWMWCLPHPKMENHTLVLLDTEGLGDVEKRNSENDMWIFCLAVLLSSTFVYNSKGVMDEDAIGKLQFVGKMSKFIKVKSGNNKDDDEAQYSRHFPSFIWAVRDFTLQLELNGQEITEDKYLENALKLQKSNNNQENNDEITKHNMYRDCIRMYFKSRKCFVFDPPTGDKEILQRMDEVSEEQLNSTFIDQTKTFCEYIYEKAEVKYMDEIRPVTGKMLGTLAKIYTEAINSSKVTCVEDVVVNISEEENKVAVLDATQHYETKMKKSVMLPTNTLKQFIELSRQCENEALQIFLSRSFKDTSLLFQKEFVENIEVKKSEFSKINEMTSREYCEELIMKHSQGFEKGLAEGVYSTPGGYQKFKEDMKLLEENYNSEPHKGIQTYQVLHEFLNIKERLGIDIMMKNSILTGLQKKEEESKVWKDKDERKKKINEDKLSEENEKLKDQMRTMEENFNQLLDTILKDNKLLEDKLTSLIEQKMREQQAYELEGDLEQAEMYKAQAKGLWNERDELRNHGFLSSVCDLFRDLWKSIFPCLYNYRL